MIEILYEKFGINASINKRTNPDGEVKWRIRISKLSIDKLINIVSPYFIPEMLYKLGLKSKPSVGGFYLLKSLFTQFIFVFCVILLLIHNKKKQYISKYVVKFGI